ncbi:MAG TPA: type II secretion system protein [Pyrinomonadaceae bacterium]
MKKFNNKNQKGFSLVELLAVVGIIGILASISIPRLLTSRRAANEGSAISSMRNIHSVEASYQSTYGQGDFADLPTLVNTKLVDETFSSNTRSGYDFVIHPSDTGLRPAFYFASAVPTVTTGLAQTGSRRFGLCEDGVLRGDGSLTTFTDRSEVEATPALNN